MRIIKVAKHIIKYIIFYNMFTVAVFAGCFPIDDMEVNIEYSPNLSCIKASPAFTCISSIELYLESSCSKSYYIYGENGEKLKLNSNESYPYDYQEQLKKGTGVWMKDIGQDIGKWERKMININDPEDIVIMKGENKYKDFIKNISNNTLTKGQKNKIQGLEYLFIFFIFAGIIGYNIYKRKSHK